MGFWDWAQARSTFRTNKDPSVSFGKKCLQSNRGSTTNISGVQNPFRLEPELGFNQIDQSAVEHQRWRARLNFLEQWDTELEFENSKIEAFWAKWFDGCLKNPINLVSFEWWLLVFYYKIWSMSSSKLGLSYFIKLSITLGGRIAQR